MTSGRSIRQISPTFAQTVCSTTWVSNWQVNLDQLVSPFLQEEAFLGMKPIKWKKKKKAESRDGRRKGLGTIT